MIGTLLFGAVTYGLGLWHGVYLREKEIVTTADIGNCGEKLASGARIIIAKVRREPVVLTTPPNPTVT